MNRGHVPFQVAVALLFAVLLASAAGAQTGAKPLRIGAVGRLLTDPEVADLVKVLPVGGVPWLMNGDGPGPFATQTQRFQVFMPPISSMTPVRHGVAYPVTRPIGDLSAWSLVRNRDGHADSFEYAQVAIAGRPFDQVLGDSDANQPFIFSPGGVGSSGTDDAELASLVKFVQSQGWGPLSGVALNLPEELLKIGWAKPGEVLVTIRGTPTKGTQLHLRKLGESWEITSAAMLFN